MIDRFASQMHAMQQLQRAQEVTANNLANLNTPGFKADKVFHRMFTEEVDGRVVSSPAASNHMVFEQGILEQTGNAFDFAIKGEGFFVVEKDDQEVLTRNGRFQLDRDGYLRDERGGKVMGFGGEIFVPDFFHANGEQDGNRFEVASDGTIRLNGEVHDRIRIVKPEDPQDMERLGNNYFLASESNRLEEDTRSQVMQGFFEKGNVNSLNEMTEMMRAMQLFESQQRIMRTTDEMLSQAVNKLGQY